MNGEERQLFMGRLGKEPDLRYTKTQKPVCYLSVAVTDEEAQKTNWNKVVVWGKQAELASQYLRKGSDVFVQGRKLLKKFTTPEGELKNYYEVNASLIGFSNL
jgi:single-strand DNA-binding protein